MKLYTIGGYGHDERSFVSKLKDHDIDLFVDIRLRRGMRGHKYSFLNATRLQKMLKEAGIEYMHLKELAPSDAVRAVQKDADMKQNGTKQNRQRLSDAFVSSYKNNVLQNLTQEEVLRAVAGHKRICFFCVEKSSEACHRSIVTNWLESIAGSARHL